MVLPHCEATCLAFTSPPLLPGRYDFLNMMSS
jgi:hypothetical protein